MLRIGFLAGLGRGEKAGIEGEDFLRGQSWSQAVEVLEVLEVLVCLATGSGFRRRYSHGVGMCHSTSNALREARINSASQTDSSSLQFIHRKTRRISPQT